MVQVVQVRVRPPRGYMDHVPSQPTFDMLTVLVVDDDRELRESLCAFLRQRGCSVTAAAGGVEGLQAVILDTFDVVVTDTQLHGSEWFWRQATTLRAASSGKCCSSTGRKRSRMAGYRRSGPAWRNRAPASRAAPNSASRRGRSSVTPGSTGATMSPALSPAAVRRRSARSRTVGSGVRTSTLRISAASTVMSET